MDRITPYTFLITSLFILIINYSNAQQTEIKYLSGTDKDNTVNWDFKIDRGRNSGKWTRIAVPSNWELQGFGVYTYGRDWPIEQPESHEMGHYKHNFEAPERWNDKTVEIVFEGSMTDTEVFINGKQAGARHQGSFYRFSYDISNLLKYGEENLLEVKVWNESENESVNKAERESDFWTFSGIYRPVYLQVKPEEHIDRLAIDARADGVFKADLYLKNIDQANKIIAQVKTLSGKPVGEPFQTDIKNNQEERKLETQINDIKTWNPEFPNLYEVEFKLQADDEVIHEVTERFGFRTVEHREGEGFFVNGQKVRFKGVNRHSFWPTSGRTLSKELSIKDVKLMKDMNMNAVRCSHYPPDKHFLEVCDSLGMFVIDEVCGWQDAYDTEVGEKLVKETVTRDVNHPSVVIWANGNEGGNNYDLVDDYHIYDPQERLVIHPWNLFNGVNTLHYSEYGCCAGTLFNGDKVFFPTEFLHGVYDGGHGAGLADWWDLMLENPLSAGGFLWVFSDCGIVRVDKDSIIDTQGSNAPDGIVGPYREKEGSYFAIKEIWSPVYIEKEFITPRFNGRLKVENRYHYTNLDQCSFEYELVNFPGPFSNTQEPSKTESGKIDAPSVALDESGHLLLDLPEQWIEYDALYLTATDPYGEEIYTWSWMIRKADDMAKEFIPSSNKKASGYEKGNHIYLEANGVQLKFNKLNGKLAKISRDNKIFSLYDGPVLAAGENTYKSMKHYQEGNVYVLEILYDGAIKNMTFKMHGSGWVEMDYEYRLGGAFDYNGISFHYPEEKVKGVKWLGKGPYRVWKNRLQGVEFGVHQKDYNNTVTGESWDYPEFKGYHDAFRWARLETEEMPLTIVSATDDLYLHLFTPDPPEGAYNENTDGKFPDGNISFMDAISPIGSKFHTADELGPSGTKNQFMYRQHNDKSWGGTVYFYFGE